LWRRQKNSAKRGLRLRGRRATESDEDASQMPYVPNEMKSYTTNSTSDPARRIRDEFVEFYIAVDKS